MSISNAEDDFRSLEEDVAFYRVKVTNLEERLRLAESARDWYKEQLTSCANEKKELEQYSAENKALLDGLVSCMSSTSKE